MDIFTNKVEKNVLVYDRRVNGSTKLILDLYLIKILDTSVKPFFRVKFRNDLIFRFYWIVKLLYYLYNVYKNLDFQPLYLASLYISIFRFLVFWILCLLWIYILTIYGASWRREMYMGKRDIVLLCHIVAYGNAILYYRVVSLHRQCFTIAWLPESNARHAWVRL